jgi:hypothetical protein
MALEDPSRYSVGSLCLVNVISETVAQQAHDNSMYSSAIITQKMSRRVGSTDNHLFIWLAFAFCG